MATSHLTRRLVSPPRQHRHRGHAATWRSGATSRQAIGRRGRTGQLAVIQPPAPTVPEERLEREPEAGLNLDGVLALSILAATAGAALWLTVQGIQHLMTGAAGYTTLDVLRVFGGLA